MFVWPNEHACQHAYNGMGCALHRAAKQAAHLNQVLTTAAAHGRSLQRLHSAGALASRMRWADRPASIPSDIVHAVSSPVFVVAAKA